MQLEPKKLDELQKAYINAKKASCDTLNAGLPDKTSENLVDDQEKTEQKSVEQDETAQEETGQISKIGKIGVRVKLNRRSGDSLLNSNNKNADVATRKVAFNIVGP